MYTRRDEISNLTIRSELQIFIISDRIKDNKKELHDHIQRMDPYRIARKAVEYKPIEHRDDGLPKRRWLLKIPIWSEHILWSTVMLMTDDDVFNRKKIAFWGIAPCSLVRVDRRFRGAYFLRQIPNWRFKGVYCLHHQGDGGGTHL
jgi:hypothetical protein